MRYPISADRLKLMTLLLEAAFELDREDPEGAAVTPEQIPNAEPVACAD